ncbi:MAG: hypothetical protein HC906_05725, partial [Bacteroidales bacterium]|nr:hypothetical protein [Bacteroidales bacterium]
MLPDQKNIFSLLQEVEIKWLKLLYNHVKQLFSHVNLPSHDHIHHFRVWQFAKQLVELLSSHNYPFTYSDLEKLIVSIFFIRYGTY